MPGINWESAKKELTVAHFATAGALLSSLYPKPKWPTWRSGYLWAAVLAATGSVMDNIPAWASSLLGSPGSFSGQLNTELASKYYSSIAYPRQTRAGVVSELTNTAVVNSLSTIVEIGLLGCLNTYGLLPADVRLLVAIIGATSCPDLRKHPASVRFSLAPALNDMYRRYPTATRSLTADGGTVVCIRKHLEDPWTTRGHW